MSSPTANPNLIVGCGYLGRRVAARWVAAGRRVVALTRRNADALAALGVEPVIGDVTDGASLHLPAADTVLYAVGMDRSGSVGGPPRGFPPIPPPVKTMREVYVNGLGHVLDTIPAAARFVYVSSTGVYGQTGGEWVDETSETVPLEESGKVVLEAERLLREKRPDAIILRFAGIYGPDRLLRKQALLNGEPLVGDAGKWLNLIHVEDGVDAVLAAEARAKPGETYLVCDDEPLARRDFYTHLAEVLGAPPARFEPHAVPAVEPNRRVSNRKAKAELGWMPRFPNYRAGLAGSA